MLRRARLFAATVIRRSALLIAAAWLLTWAPPAAGQSLVGTILVARGNGIVLVNPLSADSSTLPVGSAGASTAGVAWSAGARRIAASVRMRQAREPSPGADISILDAAGVPVSTIDRDQPGVTLTSPTWLPTGEVAYERSVPIDPSQGSRIEASTPDGATRRVVMANARLPGISPDGSRLAFVQHGQTTDRLVVADLQTGAITSLVENVTEGFYLFSAPRFSPDGRLVAFGGSGGPNLTASRMLIGGAFSRGGFFASPMLHGPNWDVWTVNADGSGGLRQVTAFDYEDDLSVAWSPDGAFLTAFGPNALYLVPARAAGPATPIGPGGLGEPDWAAADLLGQQPS